VKLQIGELVMLKVEPKFPLDRNYRGQYKIKPLTPTNIVIAPKDDNNGEKINVS